MKRIMKLIKEKLKYVFKNCELYQATAWQFMEDTGLYNYSLSRTGVWYY